MFRRPLIRIPLVTTLVILLLLFIWSSNHGPKDQLYVLNQAIKISSNYTVQHAPVTGSQRVLQHAALHEELTLTSANITQVGTIFPPNSPLPLTITSSYRINNSHICSSFLPITYIVVVHSAPANFDRRLDIRQTWGNLSLFNDHTCRVVFLLGLTSSELQHSINEENKKYGDIVQGNFMDDYKNLTLKAVMGLRWISENCPNAEFVIKADDDVFVNIFQIRQKIFPILRLSDNVIVCFVKSRGKIFRESHHNAGFSKWTIPKEYFPNLRHYPVPFCFGFVAFYPTALASRLFELSRSTPFYRLDDVYVYGILASKIKEIVWYDVSKNLFKEGDTNLNTLKQKPTEMILAATASSRSEKRRLWSRILSYSSYGKKEHAIVK